MSAKDHPRKVAIVGGGFSAASFAVQLIRRTTVPVALTIIEPRHDIGRGLAYSATDPDHRLNGPLEPHAIDPAHPRELHRWCIETGVLARDPECMLPSGEIFLRRSDLGAYLSQEVAHHSQDPRLGSSIAHVRAAATAATHAGDSFVVTTSNGEHVEADSVVIATGNPVPSLRAPFSTVHMGHPKIIGNPLEPGCLNAITRNAEVLVVGGGLTALDIVSTLVRRQHRGTVLVVSRTGLRPRGQSGEILAAEPGSQAGDLPLDMLCAEVPEFLRDKPATARAWCRALRLAIAKAERAGGGWHAPFDAVRNVVWKLWPQLPLQEKQRFLRRLRTFYDVHRFRTPPMNESMVHQAEQQGIVRYQAARVGSVDEGTQGRVAVELVPAHGQPVVRDFDFVVNCTGLDAGNAWRANPFLTSMVDQGWLRVHATQLGFDVGAECEAVGAGGSVHPLLRVIGAPTAGAFGDPLGLLFIACQISRMLPNYINTLEQMRPWSPALHTGTTEIVDA